MFDIGMQELVLICLVALIVLGPQRLPSAARQLGKAFVRIRKAARNLKYMVQQALEEDNLNE
jgi:sec-independent protein translocase protein TatB